MLNTPHYQCPLCHTQLVTIDKSLKCDNNHQFDFAKEGYIHLLPVQLKKSLQPGDDKNMVLARRAFLELGHYDFLRQALLKTIQQYNHEVLVDLGCGEGYYTNFLQQQLSDCQVYGVDISKDAVKYAAKRNKALHYSVATNAHTPFTDRSVDLIINVFAPLVGKECLRILSERGRIISVSPGAKHLVELKHAIYDKVELHEQAKSPEGFRLKKTTNIERVIELSEPKDIENLLTMTPFGWKISEQKKSDLLANLPFSLTLQFSLNEFVVDNID